ncbi:hypothetical protein PHLGIDRAFT_31510 [Phlebiopsis gigantea 11061_1 CR5-6]|uniref:Nucleoplasmin-like domain-containing protein n=1 Tax=Phlebiopsis gigantea (strain 11061_1 CR5-6) TaxID=745531 RepID=A0A0C3NH36_PHLG1|nr:hypothetical protein PHLGIDRAFT_31510 [Phlebiopsis gigantea 11061_1 CR5-6]
MSISFAVWSQAVSAEEPVEFSPRADLHVKNVTLGVDLEDENGRSTLKLVYLGPPVDGDSDEEDEDKEDGAPELVETVLCSLTPGKIENVKVDLILEANETYVFAVVGKNTLYISGNYVDQNLNDLPPNEDELVSDDEEEEAFRLEDVSSDVGVDLEGMDEDEDEEAPELIKPTSPKKVASAVPAKQESKKRPREEEPEPEKPQLSKKEQKKLNKKLKAEGGAAVPTGQPAQSKEAKKSEKKKAEPQKAETQKPVEQKNDAPVQEEGKKKKKRKNKGDKAKL